MRVISNMDVGRLGQRIGKARIYSEKYDYATPTLSEDGSSKYEIDYSEIYLPNEPIIDFWDFCEAHIDGHGGVFFVVFGIEVEPDECVVLSRLEESGLSNEKMTIDNKNGDANKIVRCPVHVEPGNIHFAYFGTLTKNGEEAETEFAIVPKPSEK